MGNITTVVKAYLPFFFFSFLDVVSTTYFMISKRHQINLLKNEKSNVREHQCTLLEKLGTDTFSPEELKEIVKEIEGLRDIENQLHEKFLELCKKPLEGWSFKWYSGWVPSFFKLK